MCGSVLSSDKEPRRTTICLPNSTHEDNSTVKNKRTWLHFFKNQYKNCSILCFFIFLTCWQCWASEWWMVDSSLIFASQDYDQTHTQTPTMSAYAHHRVFHEFIHNLQLFLFLLSYKQQPRKKRGIKQFYYCLKITTLQFPCVSKKSDQDVIRWTISIYILAFQLRKKPY